MTNVITQKADKIAKRFSDGHTRVEKKIRGFLLGSVDAEASYQRDGGPSNAVAHHHIDWPVLDHLVEVISELPAEIAKINAGVRGKTGAE
jgi:hypothetical protein